MSGGAEDAHSPFSVLAGVLGLLSAGCIADDPEATDIVGAIAEQAASGVLQPGSTIVFTGDEFSFSPATVLVEPGLYKVLFSNVGSIKHDITFADGTQAVAGPGQTVEVEVDVPPTGMEFTCDVTGHVEAGMVGAILTSESPPEMAMGGSHGASAATDQDVVEADPAAPAPERVDPAARNAGRVPGSPWCPAVRPTVGI